MKKTKRTASQQMDLNFRIMEWMLILIGVCYAIYAGISMYQKYGGGE